MQSLSVDGLVQKSMLTFTKTGNVSEALMWKRNQNGLTRKVSCLAVATTLFTFYKLLGQ